MPSKQASRRFGSPASFALEVRLLSDPDPATAPASSAGSWGEWRLWVHGDNLCAHSLPISDRTAQRQNHVTWYLAPLFRWIAEAWRPLLHEQRLPVPDRRALTARAAYLSALATRIGDDDAFSPWQAWAERHALRTAAEGGIVPDVFLRRVSDDIEASWGHRPQPGAEGVQFHAEPGAAMIPVEDVAKAFNEALQWFGDEPLLLGCPWHASVRAQIAAREGHGPAESLLPWFLDASPQPGRLTQLFEKAARDHADSSLLRPHIGSHAMLQLAPAAAMFGAVSPDISEEAGARLLGILMTARDETNEPREIEEYVEDRSALRDPYPWNDGYSLALDLLEDLDAVPEGEAVDLEGLLGRLGVRHQEEALGVSGPVGVAFAMDGVRPTIVVNSEHPLNQGEAGRRFAMAHELCHLLFDRGRAKRIAHVSTPWAPVAVEQRANAFAAMLLMPPDLLRRTYVPAASQPQLPSLKDAAKRMRVGVRALIQHLANLGTITDDDRQALLSRVPSERTTRTRKGQQ